MKYKKILVAIVGVLLSTLCYGQDKGYKSYGIGDVVDHVPEFQNVVNYPKKSFSLKELRGKLVIIDFWATWCTSCIRLMPHMEKLQKQFDGKIQVILVDPWETKANIEKQLSILKLYKTPQALSSLPNVIGDTIWRKIFVHSSVPYQVWIDSSGVVIATTTGKNATAEHVQQVLDGKKVKMVVKRDIKSSGYDVKKQGLIQTGDTSMHPLFYSAMLRKNAGYGSGALVHTDSALHLYKYTARNLPLKALFTDAYADMKPNFRMKIDVTDTVSFNYPKDANLVDEWNAKNQYSYEIAVPLSLKDSVRSFMRIDLNRYLSVEKGVAGKIELKRMTAYVIRRITDNILKPKSLTEEHTKYDTNLFHKYNVPYVEISSWLSYLENLKQSIVFVDETGIALNTTVFVDLPKHTDADDKKGLIEILRKQGLVLSKEERMIPILVIKDVTN
ncbi:MAG: thioredoxin domain-containing protein [Candidatus Pedobacter colombiensis]|uniref:Thioredoxin domain-containing protein n=1 Tax=Candidatus Pedobacter colombiensis TaxID=3121371 RepID=A0AAJ5W4I2_9SPHI|nr:thioredoxin domain-containing protein [Pedobacter sp.]WEK17919.1 MAG: thioredoxin domain-containing protein [Pedobacter sp.]